MPPKLTNGLVSPSSRLLKNKTVIIWTGKNHKLDLDKKETRLIASIMGSVQKLDLNPPTHTHSPHRSLSICLYPRISPSLRTCLFFSIVRKMSSFLFLCVPPLIQLQSCSRQRIICTLMGKMDF